MPLKIFNDKTVIVTGAGASNPYGYPLGAQLLDVISKTLTGRRQRSPLRDFLKSQHYGDDLVDEFNEMLTCAKRYETIDSLLEHHPRFRDMGCLAIAYNLAPLGNHSTLFPAKGWYEIIFKQLLMESTPERSKNSTFVTLNYEQSLEYFLKNAYRYECSEADYKTARESVEGLSFVYAHGTLGLFPKAKLPGAEITGVAVNAARNMRIISDRIEDDSSMTEAAKAISEAKSVVLLGLGYEMRTIRRLFSIKPKADRNIYGTAFKLTPSRKAEVREFFGNRILLFDCPAETFFSQMEFIENLFPSNPAIVQARFRRHEKNYLHISSEQVGDELILKEQDLALVKNGHFVELLNKYPESKGGERALLLSSPPLSLANAVYELDK